MLSPYLVASLVLAGLSAARPQRNVTNLQPIQTVTPNTAYTPSTPTGTVASFDGQISSPAQLSKRHDPDDGGDWDKVAREGIGEFGKVIVSVVEIIMGDHEETSTVFSTVTVPGSPSVTANAAPPWGTTITINPSTTTVFSTITIPDSSSVTTSPAPGLTTITIDPGVTTVFSTITVPGGSSTTSKTTLTQEPITTTLTVDPGTTTITQEPVTTTLTQEPITTTLTQEPEKPTEPTGSTTTVTGTTTVTAEPTETQTVILPVAPPKSGCYIPGKDGKLTVGECHGKPVSSRSLPTHLPAQITQLSVHVSTSKLTFVDNVI